MLHSLNSYALQPGGFSFENSRRNAVLESNLSQAGYKAPNARKTGTTIAGIVYKDGVILGADTRATDDMVVADKNCMKIHYIAPKIYCCGAGVAADAEITTQIMSSNVELHMLNTGRPPLVAMVTRQLKQMLFRYQGHVGSSLIVGGVDVTGAHLYSVYPHGSYDKLPFLTMDVSLVIRIVRLNPAAVDQTKNTGLDPNSHVPGLSASSKRAVHSLRCWLHGVRKQYARSWNRVTDNSSDISDPARRTKINVKRFILKTLLQLRV